MTVAMLDILKKPGWQSRRGDGQGLVEEITYCISKNLLTLESVVSTLPFKLFPTF